jgi:hypothetical protein
MLKNTVVIRIRVENQPSWRLAGPAILDRTISQRWTATPKAINPPTKTKPCELLNCRTTEFNLFNKRLCSFQQNGNRFNTPLCIHNEKANTIPDF